MPELKKEITSEDILKELDRIKKELPNFKDPWQYWVQGMKFGEYESTQIGPSQDWRISLLPKDYTGKAVLDIGGADGFYSFNAEDKGSSRVLITDLRRNIKREMAFRLYDTKVEEKIIDIYDMDEINEQFDIIIFMGVLYHLKHPILGLEKVYNKLKEGGELYLETLIYVCDGLDQKLPIAEYIEDDRCNNDITNWWAPTIETGLAMMRTVGFKEPKFLSKHNDRGFFYAKR